MEYRGRDQKTLQKAVGFFTVTLSETVKVSTCLVCLWV